MQNDLATSDLRVLEPGKMPGEIMDLFDPDSVISNIDPDYLVVVRNSTNQFTSVPDVFGRFGDLLSPMGSVMFIFSTPVDFGAGFTRDFGNGVFAEFHRIPEPSSFSIILAGVVLVLIMHFCTRLKVKPGFPGGNGLTTRKHFENLTLAGYHLLPISFAGGSKKPAR